MKKTVKPLMVRPPLQDREFNLYLPFRLPPALFGRWVRTDAATLFTLAGVRGFLSNSLAFVATLFDVCSVFFFDMFLLILTDERFQRDRPG